MEKTGYRQAVAAQADNLKVTYRSVSDALASADLPPWGPQEVITVVAMGASSFSADALVSVLRENGRLAVNLTASDVAHAPSTYRPGDHFLLVSESGRSPEPIDAARSLPTGRRIAVTNDPDAPIAEVVDHLIPLGGWADSRVYTSGFTATLLSYAALIQHHLGPALVTDPQQIPQIVREVTTAVGPQLDRAVDLLSSVRALDVAAQGASLAAAGEGALMLREGARIHASAFDTYQYIHGPMEALGPDTGVILLGAGRELPIAEMTVARGVPTVLIAQESQAPVSDDDAGSLVRITLPDGLADIGLAVAETVVLQWLTLGLTERLGLDIDEFLYDQPDTKLRTADAD